QTAIANTLDTGEVQITATIDEKVKLVFETSIRRHLKLEDSDGISTLPNIEIFEQLALICLSPKKTSWEQFSSNIGEGSTVPVESHYTPSGAPTTSQLPFSSPSRIPTRQETKVPQPSSPTHTNVADEAASIGEKLEKIVKSTKARRRAKIVVSDDEDAAEDTSKRGRKIDAIDQDLDISLAQHDAEKKGRGFPVHEEASSFNVEELEDIQATIEADEELALRIQAEEMEKYSEAEKARLLVDLINQIKRHELKSLFEETIKRVKTFTPMESDVDRTIPKIANESLKRVAEEELKQESSKRQTTRESLKPREKENDDELTHEDLQQIVLIVPVEEVSIEALHAKYPIIDWEF
nr:hypothetical protein [Tanacetum cinerariifolium]